MEDMESSDPVLLKSTMLGNNQPGINQEDCFFYYYASCTKGSACPYRHEPAALGNETTCRFWAQGLCMKQNCTFRHLEVATRKNQVPCYFEKQPGGCKRAHCPFYHGNSLDDANIKKRAIDKTNSSTSTSPQGSNGSSPSVSRSVSPVHLFSSFVVSLSDSDSDDGDVDPVAQPVHGPCSSLDENIREMEIVKAIQQEQAQIMGYPLPTPEVHRGRPTKLSKPSPLPQQMFVDEVEDIFEEVPEDTPKEPSQALVPAHHPPVVVPANQPSVLPPAHPPPVLPPAHQPPVPSPLFNISVISSVREDVQSPSAATLCNSILSSFVSSSPRDQGSADHLRVLASTPLGEARERRVRRGGVASAILSRTLGPRAKPISVQPSIEASSLRYRSVHDRLEGRISAFKDTQTDISSPNNNWDRKHFEPYSTFNDNFSTSDDRVTKNLPSRTRVYTKYSEDESTHRRTVRAHRRIINSTNGCAENFRVNSVNGQAEDMSNEFKRKPTVSSPSGIYIKSLEEIRREKAAKRMLEESYDSSDSGPKRGLASVRAESGNKRFRLDPEAQSFIPSTFSRRDTSTSVGSFNSFSSDDDLDILESGIINPLFGYEGGSYYGRNS